MLTEDRCKKLMRDVGMPQSQSLQAALFQANMEGHLYGRREEQQRILTEVQQLRDAWIDDYLQLGRQIDVSLKKAFSQVLNIIEQGAHEP